MNYFDLMNYFYF